MAVLVLFSACTPKNKDQENISIALMPDAAALPLLLMKNVKIIPFLSARERDTAMQLGELDGMMSDLVSVLLHGQSGLPLKVLTLTESRFLLVSAPDFDENQLWTIAISENSVIEYMTDQWLDGREVDKVAIPQVPIRMEMLNNGKVPMACLTDAMAWPLLQKGFKIVRDQKETSLDPAVLVFSSDFTVKNGRRIESFKKDWNSAAAKINSAPDKYRSLLLDQIRLPDTSEKPYPVPFYKEITLPTKEQYQSVLDWYTEKYEIDKKPDYNEIMIP
jgi:NitT/TauT family transport system substrate-binding protein